MNRGARQRALEAVYYTASAADSAEVRSWIGDRVEGGMTADTYDHGYVVDVDHLGRRLVAWELGQVRTWQSAEVLRPYDSAHAARYEQLLYTRQCARTRGRAVPRS